MGSSGPLRGWRRARIERAWDRLRGRLNGRKSDLPRDRAGERVRTFGHNAGGSAGVKAVRVADLAMKLGREPAMRGTRLRENIGRIGAGAAGLAGGKCRSAALERQAARENGDERNGKQRQAQEARRIAGSSPRQTLEHLHRAPLKAAVQNVALRRAGSTGRALYFGGLFIS